MCNQSFFNLPFRILIAPLDWGLGHATRCIPVIRYFIEKGCHVTIAASGATSLLLQHNFPEVPQLLLPGYNITYSRSGGSFVAKILSQIPRIFRAIGREKRWLMEMQATHTFDLVVSDNRYGLKIDRLKSVVMTHQLQIMTGFGAFADCLMRKLHYRMLEKFDACWVVDNPGSNALGGLLSHPFQLPSNARYIGLLSQLHASNTPAAEQTGRVLILLSGPEPMRGILEKKLIEEAGKMEDYHFNIIAGNPAGMQPANIPAHITYTTHANAGELENALSAAQLVICRSGYSTLMDLAVYGKKALLIPTPGQTEQEYLARHLQTKGLFVSQEQHLLDLKRDITEALQLPGFSKTFATSKLDLMKEVVDITLLELEH